MDFYKVVLLLAYAVAVTAAAPMEEFYISKPNSFGYAIKDEQRKEVGDWLHKGKESHSFKDERDIERLIHSLANKEGFLAETKTNEPGTASVNPTATKTESSAYPHFGMKKKSVTPTTGGFIGIPEFSKLKAGGVQKTDSVYNSGSAAAKEKEATNREASIAELVKDGLFFDFEKNLKELAKDPEDVTKEAETLKRLEELLKKESAILPADVAGLEKEGSDLADAEKLAKLIYSTILANRDTEFALKEEFAKESIALANLGALNYVPKYTTHLLPILSPFVPKPKGFHYGGQYLGRIFRSYDIPY